MSNLKIRPLNDDDIKIIKTWLYKPHVKPWFTHPLDWIDEINKRFDEFSFIKHFITMHDDKPIGFCQYYKCKQDDPDFIYEGTYSIDYLIGEEEFLQKGYGKAQICLLINKVFSNEDAKTIIVDPDKENLISKKSLLSNGFVFKDNKYQLSKRNFLCFS